MFAENTEGIFHNLPARQYHAAPGVSNSMLKRLARSPAHLQTYLEQPPEQTPAMLFGQIVHQLLLEPDKPWFWAVRPPGLDGRSKEGKEWKARVGEKPVLEHAQWINVEGAVHSVRSHPTAMLALGSGKSEVSVFRKFTLGHSVLRKARIDFINDGNALVDIKTTDDARPDAFARTLFNLRYHVQAAYYLDIWNDSLSPGETPKESFVFIAVEKEPPYAIGVYDLSRAAINAGRQEYIRLLQLYMECEAQGEWPAYNPDVREINLPAWALRKGEFSLAA
ncbi:MAG TPA: PD-(D/E)XK nuclease-like domain-containing protein [Verrucomicrobiae bacterium]|nr:PD-(D/E)XK nuclease-like domain-containing protein [Verrucomicrobiae bacterium]